MRIGLGMGHFDGDRDARQIAYGVTEEELTRYAGLNVVGRLVVFCDLAVGQAGEGARASASVSG